MKLKSFPHAASKADSLGPYLSAAAMKCVCNDSFSSWIAPLLGHCTRIILLLEIAQRQRIADSTTNLARFVEIGKTTIAKTLSAPESNW